MNQSLQIRLDFYSLAGNHCWVNKSLQQTFLKSVNARKKTGRKCVKRLFLFAIMGWGTNN